MPACTQIILLICVLLLKIWFITQYDAFRVSSIGGSDLGVYANRRGRRKVVVGVGQTSSETAVTSLATKMTVATSLAVRDPLACKSARSELDAGLGEA